MQFYSQYAYRVVNYDCKLLIKFATRVVRQCFYSKDFFECKAPRWHMYNIGC